MGCRPKLILRLYEEVSTSQIRERTILLITNILCSAGSAEPQPEGPGSTPETIV